VQRTDGCGRGRDKLRDVSGGGEIGGDDLRAAARVADFARQSLGVDERALVCSATPKPSAASARAIAPPILRAAPVTRAFRAPASLPMLRPAPAPPRSI
jgi:hypothetical protein